MKKCADAGIFLIFGGGGGGGDDDDDDDIDAGCWMLDEVQIWGNGSD